MFLLELLIMRYGLDMFPFGASILLCSYSLALIDQSSSLPKTSTLKYSSQLTAAKTHSSACYIASSKSKSTKNQQINHINTISSCYTQTSPPSLRNCLQQLNFGPNSFIISGFSPFELFISPDLLQISPRIKQLSITNDIGEFCNCLISSGFLLEKSCNSNQDKSKSTQE